jgi:hypothetical protein
MGDRDEDMWRKFGEKYPLEYALLVDFVDEFVDMWEDIPPDYAIPNMIFSSEKDMNAVEMLIRYLTKDKEKCANIFNE